MQVKYSAYSLTFYQICEEKDDFCEVRVEQIIQVSYFRKTVAYAKYFLV